MRLSLFLGLLHLFVLIIRSVGVRIRVRVRIGVGLVRTSETSLSRKLGATYFFANLFFGLSLRLLLGLRVRVRVGGLVRRRLFLLRLRSTLLAFNKKIRSLTNLGGRGNSLSNRFFVFGGGRFRIGRVLLLRV